MENKTYNGLNYRMFGNGHPVLFIHGFLESMAMWQSLNLSKLDCCCILVDIPGHGTSELRTEETSDPSISFFAQQINELILHLKLNDIDIIGHSMGGYVGLELMKINPKARKIMLLNSNFWADSEEKKNDRVAVAELVWKQKSLFLKTAIPNLFFDAKNHLLEIKSIIDDAELISSLGIAYASLAMRNRSDFAEFVAQFPEKLTIVQGVNDPIVKNEVMANALPKDVKIAYLDNCGHMAHIEQSDAVTACIIDFLA